MLMMRMSWRTQDIQRAPRPHNHPGGAVEGSGREPAGTHLRAPHPPAWDRWPRGLPATVLSPAACGLGCARVRGGGSRGRTQWKFPLPAAATAATTAAAARRKAGAGPEPPQGRGGSRPAARPARLGAPSPVPGVPHSAPRGPGRRDSRRAGSCSRGRGGGGGACGGQGAARRSVRSCRRPLSRAARPSARCVCSPGTARVEAAASSAGAALSSSPPPSPPSSSPVPRQSPLLPPQPSSAMPRYELALILKAMQRPETAAVLKRTVEALMERGAIVRNLENLGERALPYKISKHNQRHRRGGYFLVDLEAPPSIVSTMMDHLGRDIDVIRRAFIKHPVSKTEECSGIVPVNYEDKLIPRKR
ncbi:28S ribosomal protein S6, mitochondrial [Numida meleagris]|uniref:28S ribosomal protein S6, mitochondrial n=1 Tax=Numida meleagris TaxID=8996 RepID=UPI000B3DCE5D|nr:28S ribosomal protein S6, mitochondrial [Numida meleagris]